MCPACKVNAVTITAVYKEVKEERIWSYAEQRYQLNDSNLENLSPEIFCGNCGAKLKEAELE